MKEEEVKLYLKGFQTKFCIALIDKYRTTFLLFVKKNSMFVGCQMNLGCMVHKVKLINL